MIARMADAFLNSSRCTNFFSFLQLEWPNEGSADAGSFCFSGEAEGETAGPRLDS